MDLLKNIFEYFLHLDKNLIIITQQYGLWTYLLLFLVLFAETGLVIAPFLPGDSLIFAAGTLAAVGSLNIWVLFIVSCFAAILGDTVNYWIGHKLGKKLMSRPDSFFFKKEYAERTQKFFEKYGGKTIVIARFVPIIRTFAPFVAGLGKMEYSYFIAYNIFGGILWVGVAAFGGYFFGNLPFVRDNFALVIAAVIVISLLPPVYELIKYKLKKNN